MARDQDFAKFYREEVRFRKELGYPPFSRMINIRIEAMNQKRAGKAAEEMGQLGGRLLGKDWEEGSWGRKPLAKESKYWDPLQLRS
jgi:primosomal protein N' (replication factor Y)